MAVAKPQIGFGQYVRQVESAFPGIKWHHEQGTNIHSSFSEVLAEQQRVPNDPSFGIEKCSHTITIDAPRRAWEIVLYLPKNGRLEFCKGYGKSLDEAIASAKSKCD